MYASIRRYQTNSSSIQSVIQQVRQSFLPTINKLPGFIDYYLVDGGGGSIITISIFENEASAAESELLAASWVKYHFAVLFSSPPEVTSGEVKIHAVEPR